MIRFTWFTTLFLMAWALPLKAHGQTIPSKGVSKFEWLDSEVRASNSPQALVPNGALSDPVSLECHPRQLEDILVDQVQKGSGFADLINDYFQKCEAELSRNNPTGLDATEALTHLKYNIWENPDVRKIRLHFNGGETQDGFVAFKGDNKKRAFVVIKQGLHGQGQKQNLVKLLMMHLFDESPFNLLILDSHTGQENSIHNQRLSLGGSYEGQELMDIGFWVRYQSPFRNSFSGLHLLGMNTSGNSVLYSALFNDFNPINDETKVYNSVVSYCPAVNLEQSLKRLHENLPAHRYADPTRDYIAEIWSWVPDLQKLVNQGDYVADAELSPLMAQTSLAYLQKYGSKKFLYPLKYADLENTADYWRLNNFLNHSEGIETPTYVLGAQDDDVISFRENSGALANKHRIKSGGLRFLNTSKGGHCAQSLSYGWATMSSVLRSIFLEHSADFWIKREKQTLKAPLKKLSLAPGELHVAQEWTAHQGQSYLTLNLKTWMPCKKSDPFSEERSCYRDNKQKVNFKDLAALNLSAPQSKTDTEVLTRWANSYLEVHDKKERLIGTANSPAFIKLLSY